MQTTAARSRFIIFIETPSAMQHVYLRRAT
jgi:hypothetical protein